MKIEINKGIDENGEFLESGLVSEFNKSRESFTRHYYKTVDKAILENMPDIMFEDLKAKIEAEAIRRGVK